MSSSKEKGVIKVTFEGKEKFLENFYFFLKKKFYKNISLTKFKVRRAVKSNRRKSGLFKFFLMDIMIICWDTS